MKKALLKRKRRNPLRMKKKVVVVIDSKKESEKKGKYTHSTRNKLKHELETMIEEDDMFIIEPSVQATPSS